MAVLLLSTFGCKKDRSADGTYARENIQYAGGEVEETKGFLEANGLQNAGTQVKVYDFLTGFDGTINGQMNLDQRRLNKHRQKQLLLR